jgi:hypothetical protein
MRIANAAQRPDPAGVQNAMATAEFLANRLGTETFLRGVDLLNETVGGEICYGLALNALWCLHLNRSIAPRQSLVLPCEWNKPMGIHQLARALNLPYPTLHRHLGVLIGKGLAIRTAEGRVELSVGFVEGKSGEDFRRRALASSVRFLVGLHRIGVLTGTIAPLERGGGLDKIQQDLIFGTTMEILLWNLLLTARFHGDLAAGLVFKLIGTANIRHLTSVPYGVVGFFPDTLRQPVSIYGIAKSLHMSYETTRRIVKKLQQEDACRQVGDQGFIIPADAHRRTEHPLTKSESFRSIAAGIAQISSSGLTLALVDF